MSERWFEVTAQFKIRAESEDEAINVVADAMTDRGTGRVFPVGTFNARLIGDPTRSGTASTIA
jgi:hypothetical protein